MRKGPLIEQLEAYLSKNTTKDSYHWHGRSIIMPSGSGKSYFVEKQSKMEFLDADPILWAVGAMPPPTGKGKNLSGLSWDKDGDEIMKRCDKVTRLLKQKNLWIMGATWWNIKLVDAVVILPKELNKKYLDAKDDAFDDDYYEKELAPYIKNILRPEAKKNNVPIFKSIGKVVDHIKKENNPYK